MLQAAAVDDHSSAQGVKRASTWEKNQKEGRGREMAEEGAAAVAACAADGGGACPSLPV